jgi:nucleoside-diphosphate-sugar epimerase
MKGNLLSSEDCAAATKDVAVIFHLAAGTGEKSFPDAFMNSVVTTRNLLEGSLRHGSLRRIVSASSFAVYSNRDKPRGRVLDESCPIAENPGRRDAYLFSKVRQDEIVSEYGKRFGIPYVIVRPGVVYGPGKKAITSHIGTDTFGIFLHLGGSNKIPFTYVDNCAEAIALAGLRSGWMARFSMSWMTTCLRAGNSCACTSETYENSSPSVPHAVSYALCDLWERYSRWSQGQLPPAFNRGIWHSFWKDDV